MLLPSPLDTPAMPHVAAGAKSAVVLLRKSQRLLKSFKEEFAPDVLRTLKAILKSKPAKHARRQVHNSVPVVLDNRPPPSPPAKKGQSRCHHCCFNRFKSNASAFIIDCPDEPDSGLSPSPLPAGFSTSSSDAFVSSRQTPVFRRSCPMTFELACQQFVAAAASCQS